MSKIRRNDPCPCGSGKKYKHCCQDKIETEQRRENAQADFHSGFTPDEIQSLKEDQQRAIQMAISKVTLQNIKKLAGNENGELDEITWKLETEIQFEEKRTAIMTIIERLSKHHGEYEIWNRDNPTEVFQHAMHLFSEAPFKKMFFKKEDIEHIVKSQGSLPSIRDAQRFKDYAARALNTLLDDMHLKIIAHLLLLQVPDYYSQKRYMDACLILNSAHLVIMFKDEGNDTIPAFLICKFGEALHAWMKDRDQQSANFLQKIGLGIDELRKKFQGKGKDLDISEEQKAQLTEYLQEHPELNEELQTELAEQQETMKKLLETSENDSLLFRGKELEPWFVRIAKALEADQRLQKNLNEQTTISEPEDIAIFTKILDKVSEEMADEIFTDKRLKRLNKDIQSLQKNLLKQGRQEYH
ncbi:MAG: SEC-C domain-containing protein, partial [Lentisphaeria bacterium]